MKPRYFLTAYGIALKHGFEGTEEEWLASLTAFALAQAAGYSGSLDQWLRDLNDPIPAFDVGTVETLPSDAQATVTLGGTRRNPVLNFGIPRGYGYDGMEASIEQLSVELKKYVSETIRELTADDVDALPLSGGIMTGGIDMNGQQLKGLKEPAADDEAVPKSYVDALDAGDVGALPLSGGTMTGAINMDGHSLYGLGTPTNDSEAVSKWYAEFLLKPVLLWENASPTSNFAAQTVELDLSPYSRVMVCLRTSTSDASTTFAYWPVGQAFRVLGAGYPGDGMFIVYRSISAAAEKMTFSNATGRTFLNSSSASITSDATRLIPVAIYGIR